MRTATNYHGEAIDIGTRRATIDAMSTAQLTTPVFETAPANRSERRFRTVRIVLGVLLLTAAGLKLYGWNVTALPRVGWFATPRVQVAAAEWELVLGLWLLSGAAQFGAWLAALGTFLAFAGVSGYFGWIGVASCGCFGVIHTSPWTAFGVDIAALFALFVSRPSKTVAAAPSASKGSNVTETIGSRLVIPLTAGAILIGLTAIGSWVYGSPEAALVNLRGEALTLYPEHLDFGTGKPGDVIERTVEVHNWTNKAIKLIGGTSDCSCVTTTDLPTAVGAGEASRIRIQMRVPPAKTGALTRIARIWTDLDRYRTIRLQVGCQVLQPEVFPGGEQRTPP